MTLKIISFIFFVSLTFGIPVSTQAKDVPFDMNEVIEKVNNSNNELVQNSAYKPLDSEQGEFLIDTTVVYHSIQNTQVNPSVAFDGTNYLVVWQDERGPDDDIYGVRVSQNGTILDFNGISISTATNRQEYPTVCFDGTNYFVVWQDYRIGFNNYDIYGTRVSQTGIVLNPNGIAISMAAANQKYPSVIWGGSNHLVVWQDERNGYPDPDIYGTRVSQSGTVLDPAGIAISTASNTQRAPSLAFDNNNYLVVWQDARNSGILYPDIFGARIDQSGLVLDSTGFIISAASNSQSEPSVEFDGTNYLVVWADGRNNDIFGARITTAGQVLDTSGIAISTALDDQNFPAVAFDGTNFLVVWQDHRTQTDFDIYGTRVSQSGIVLDTFGLSINTSVNDQCYPSVCFDSANFLIVWQDHRNGFHNNIYGARMNLVGNILDSLGFAIAITGSSQNDPSVAFDGTNYLVVWSDDRSYPYPDIFGARVDREGNVLDQAGIAISTAPDSQLSPSVAFDGFNYLVVWSDKRNGNYDIYGTLVSPEGNVLDSAGIPINTEVNNQQYPSITSSHSNYLVVWQDIRNGNFDIYGTRVNRDGIVLDPSGIGISADPAHQSVPSIAFDITNYLVVWHDHRNGSRPDIYSARVNQSGVVLDPFGRAICTVGRDQEYPSVAFDGTNYLVVWQDDHFDNMAYWDIAGTRVNQSGVVLDPIIRITYYGLYHNSPSVDFVGSLYYVVWENQGDIIGANLNTSGVRINLFTVSSQEGTQTRPAISHGSGDQTLIVYSGWTDSINTHKVNAMRIWGKFGYVGIKEPKITTPLIQNDFLVYPNPAQSFLAIRLPQSANRTELKIFDVSGKMVKDIEILRSAQNDKTGETKISLKGINPGIYFLKFELGAKIIKKLIVMR